MDMDAAGGKNAWDVQKLINAELDSGERLAWSGMPRQGLMLRPADALLIPFSLLWGGFACFWEYSVLHTNAPFFFRLWGIPFVLVGLYLIVGRFFYDSYLRARTYYGVTDERAIIVGGAFAKSVTSLRLADLAEVTLVEGVNGTGTIRFGPEPFGASAWGGGWPGGNARAAPRFEGIAGVRRVYELVRAGRARR